MIQDSEDLPQDLNCIKFIFCLPPFIAEGIKFGINRLVQVDSDDEDHSQNHNHSNHHNHSHNHHNHHNQSHHNHQQPPHSPIDSNGSANAMAATNCGRDSNRTQKHEPSASPVCSLSPPVTIIGHPHFNGHHQDERRRSRSRSRSLEGTRSRSRSSSSELEVDSPVPSPMAGHPNHNLHHHLHQQQHVVRELSPPIRRPTSTPSPKHLTPQQSQIGKRSELFSVTNLLRDDGQHKTMAHKGPSITANLFHPHIDMLRYVSRVC